jgi:quercetin dioxygenase-like cupin family protein
MNQNRVRVIPWSGGQTPTESELERLLEGEGLSYYRWSDAPGDVYDAHTHAYDKVIYVVRGSITFGLPEEGQEIRLKVGDCLDLPAGMAHDAVVGPQGVTCLEAHRR